MYEPTWYMGSSLASSPAVSSSRPSESMTGFFLVDLPMIFIGTRPRCFTSLVYVLVHGRAVLGIYRSLT